MDWYETLKAKLKPIGQIETFEEHSIAAGVLVPVGMNRHTFRPEILLTKRTAEVETHKNQIGFPGGLYSVEDGKNLLFTALRETEEEIGVKRDDLELLGQLTALPTLFNVKIFPFVARMEFPYPFVLNASEVARLIPLPLETLLHKGFEPVTVEVDGHKVKSIGLEIEGELLWGASAKILDEFRSLLLS